MTVNCYLVWDEVTRDAALFDTGIDATPVLNCITENNLTLRHIFITHSHWDHVEALPKFREAWPKAKLHSGSKKAPVDQRNKPSEIIHLGGLRVTHRETPGHAEDGVTYLVGNWQEDAPHVAFVGDTIFAGSMGRGNDSWDLARQQRARADFIPAACNPPLSRPRPHDDGRRRTRTQSVLLILDFGRMRRFNFQNRK